MSREISKGPLSVDVRVDRGNADYFVITDLTGAVICDTFNSEVAVIEEETDGDENGIWINRWDSRGKADMKYLALAGNCYPVMVEALKAAQIMVNIMLECWGDTSTNDNGKFRNITGSSVKREIENALKLTEESVMQ